jgi:hypothetical protein
MIFFSCSGCGRNLQIADKKAGLLAGCPFCGTNTRVPGTPKRTSKLAILTRISAFPLAVVGFWASLLSLERPHGTSSERSWLLLAKPTS